MKTMPGSKNNNPKPTKYQDKGLGAASKGVKSPKSDMGASAGLNSGKVTK